jgi:hypothetical protein
VTGYTIERYIPELPQTTDFSLPASVSNWQDSTFPLTTLQYGYPSPTYRIKARYAAGDSGWSSVVPLFLDGTSGSGAVLIRGPQGNPYLMASLPPNAATVRVELYDGSAGVLFTSWVVPASVFTNGPYAVPQCWIATLPTYPGWFLQAADSSSNIVVRVWADQTWFRSAPFYDGREQLKDNLSFLLRTDGDDLSPFAFWWHYDSLSEIYMDFPTAYRFADMYNVNSPYALLYSSVYEFEPFIQNNLLRNFTFAQADLGPGGYLNTGLAALEYPPLYLDYPATYMFQPPTGPTNIPSLLAPAQSRWTCLEPIAVGSVTDQKPGLIQVTSTNIVMSAGATNLFGLPYLSAQLAWGNGPTDSLTLEAGQSTPLQGCWFYWEAQQPDLHTVDYYFTALPGLYPECPAQSPLPGETAFSPTNTTPLLITAAGAPIRVVGYAKQIIRNGDLSKYAFLGQYFDQAYLANPDGTPGTNQTGLLSEYGEFLPTEPGLAILTTQPDLTQTNNLQGQCPVYVISLALDANHDGTMDLNFTGPDNTSQARPFVFWINNDYDRLKWDADDSTNYEDSVTAAEANNIPDCNYTNNAGYRAIPTMRDLEDFARLWTCGISSLYSNLPPGSTVSLSWGDVGSPNPANPTIDLFEAADPDGGTGYLTNATIASQQIDPTYALYKGRLGPGQSLRLDSCLFGPCWHGDQFIWCGVSSGFGRLTLTIADAQSNALAQTSAYIQLQDIKQMYERWTVGERPGVAPANTAYLAQEDVAQPFQYGASTDPNTPYILFVHGWNLDRYDKDRLAESAFKRLYWQGYQGRFGSFRWPTKNGFKGTLVQLVTSPAQKDNFDLSEYTAWQSAAGLLNKLNDLNAEYPGQVYVLAHSMGNVVAGEALRLAAQQGLGQLVNTYVASQAAISAHTYDGDTNDVPNYSFYYPPWRLAAITPNIYSNWFAGNNGGGAGTVVSFYNTNDYALQRSAWQLDQLLKPDKYVPMGGSIWDYSYNGLTNDPPPWNHFEKEASLGVTMVSFDIVNVLTNRYEVMALAAESWTTALGATPSVGNVADIDLRQLWPPDTSTSDPTKEYVLHFWHSAEFRGDYWQQQGYWQGLLGPQGFDLR